LNGVIVVQVVNADDRFPSGQEPRRDMETNEACYPSHQSCQAVLPLARSRRLPIALNRFRDTLA